MKSVIFSSLLQWSVQFGLFCTTSSQGTLQKNGHIYPIIQTFQLILVIKQCKKVQFISQICKSLWRIDSFILICQLVLTYLRKKLSAMCLHVSYSKTLCHLKMSVLDAFGDKFHKCVKKNLIESQTALLAFWNKKMFGCFLVPLSQVLGNLWDLCFVLLFLPNQSM